MGRRDAAFLYKAERPPPAEFSRPGTPHSAPPLLLFGVGPPHQRRRQHRGEPLACEGRIWGGEGSGARRPWRPPTPPAHSSRTSSASSSRYAYIHLLIFRCFSRFFNRLVSWGMPPMLSPIAPVARPRDFYSPECEGGEFDLSDLALFWGQ